MKKGKRWSTIGKKTRTFLQGEKDCARVDIRRSLGQRDWEIIQKDCATKKTNGGRKKKRSLQVTHQTQKRTHLWVPGEGCFLGNETYNSAKKKLVGGVSRQSKPHHQRKGNTENSWCKNTLERGGSINRWRGRGPIKKIIIHDRGKRGEEVWISWVTVKKKTIRHPQRGKNRPSFVPKGKVGSTPAKEQRRGGNEENLAWLTVLKEKKKFSGNCLRGGTTTSKVRKTPRERKESTAENSIELRAKAGHKGEPSANRHYWKNWRRRWCHSPGRMWRDKRKRSRASFRESSPWRGGENLGNIFPGAPRVTTKIW